MPRTSVPAADALLDVELPALNRGFVRLVDYMGGDGAGTKSYRQDRGLIHYLLRNAHTSPFEQVVLTFHLKMPIFVARQWIRHRTARLNEISGRYSVIKDEFYLPHPDQVSHQSEDNKQGRGAPLPPDQAEDIVRVMEEEQKAIYGNYETMLNDGVARELARSNLPLSTYTEMYWQCDLHNLFHFLRLRLDAHAQYEIRVFAEQIATCVRAVAPMSYEAFEEHVLNAVTFSKTEASALAALLEGRVPNLDERPRALFEAKLGKLKALVPVEAPEEPVRPT
ncbi:MAG: thymidylate synthase (FAD) [Armatimonadota bacterium]